MNNQKKQRRGEEKPIKANKMPVSLIMTMLFVSGFSGLVYQVLWMKQLSMLFGNTSHATSVTLAAFFAGLGAGSWWWGKRSGGVRNPLRLYAQLEIGIALTALAYFVILKVFYAIYPQVYSAISGTGWLLLLKFGLSLVLIFPPAFFMGGTVPAIGQTIIRNRAMFGRMAAFIYAINTLGAALGVAIAAFVLVPSLGYRMTYILALSLSVGIGVVSWRFSRRPEMECPQMECDDDSSEAALTAGKENAIGGSLRGRGTLALLCFFSGFTVLGLEVVWTRIFAQVHENSVYSFAIILTVVLVCLALGAWLASGLARFVQTPFKVVGLIMAAGGVALVIGPSLLMKVTHGLEPIHELESWGDHVSRIFKMGFGGIWIVVILLGTLFPFLMKVAERDAKLPGKTIGSLLALNTVGAIAGSLLCGFVLLPSMGMWGAMRFLAACFLVVGMLVPIGWGHAGVVSRSVGAISLLLLFTALDPTKLPTHGQHPQKMSEKVLETWESSDCTVAVTKTKQGHIGIRVNGSYSLGSTSAFIEQANQARIPLHIYPETKSLCFIGMGTGMSAGAALDDRFPNVKRVVTCELTPAVVKAAKKYIPKELTRGLFSDPRSTVLTEDGRHFLMASNQTFDMINADLFLPYRRGAGSLYSLDHYRAAAKRLNPGGVFVQWLPLYQLTEFEFGVITRTMLEAFGQVTMWRNNFVPGLEKVALIGQRRTTPLPLAPVVNREAMANAVNGLEVYQASPDMVRAEAEAILFFYCGNMTAARGLFDSYPINTDDRPVIEYQTPRTFRKGADTKSVVWFVGPKIAEMTQKILTACPVAEDPMLEGHTVANRRLVSAGAAFHQAMIWKQLGQPAKSRAEWEIFKTQWRMSAQ